MPKDNGTTVDGGLGLCAVRWIYAVGSLEFIMHQKKIRFNSYGHVKRGGGGVGKFGNVTSGATESSLTQQPQRHIGTMHIYPLKLKSGLSLSLNHKMVSAVVKFHNTVASW